MSQTRWIWIFIAIALISLSWSAVGTKDYGVWLFELFPAAIGIAILALSYHRFSFSTLVYALVCIHFCVLTVGAKYTYAEVPLFNWLRDTLDLSRNHFDRLGHFMQGFVPVIIAREFLIRIGGAKPGGLLFFLTLCICLAISAFYELLEMWMVFVFYAQEGAEWLGWQGDIWDAQWDMTMALLGAFLSYSLLRKLHDASMKLLDLKTISNS